MADGAHDVGLMGLFIDGVAHGFAINRQTLVDLTVLGIPSTQRLIELLGVNADQGVADDGQTRYLINPMAFSATESTACFLAQLLGTNRNILVAAHAAQHGGGSHRQYAGQRMFSALATTKISNLREKIVQRQHLLGG